MFTCPFGTYAYRRMHFGLCNAPATFQRCMLAIFHDMIEESVKVFVDDFSVFGSSFDQCLNNLDKMIQRCKDTHLVLNWEKFHFMTKEVIVIGHKVSKAGLKVDKAKIEVISNFHPPLISKKGTENVAADHLSRIENDETSDDSEVNDNFPRETLMEMNTDDEPWFADFANYLPKLRSRWLGPYAVKHQYPSGYVELYGKDGKTFIVNGHRLKFYHEEEDYNDQREAITPFFPLVPSCYVIFDLEPLSLSFDFVFSYEIFKSCSLRSLSSLPPCDLVS
ncbi:reverse transcriptase domain-containing protein [Tanacetum coccineum]|uniref:Reverse transcriptase domain-containing protein n=1 Tax=Tanacetum coccineum TaxID=301880 RepID=A0ABQ4WUY8_9ASTR